MHCLEKLSFLKKERIEINGLIIQFKKLGENTKWTQVTIETENWELRQRTKIGLINTHKKVFCGKFCSKNDNLLIAVIQKERKNTNAH